LKGYNLEFHKTELVHKKDIFSATKPLKHQV